VPCIVQGNDRTIAVLYRGGPLIDPCSVPGLKFHPIMHVGSYPIHSSAYNSFIDFEILSGDLARKTILFLWQNFEKTLYMRVVENQVLK